MNPAFLDRLRKGIASEIFANLTRVVIQVGGVPLFLAFWGGEGYGEWLLLTAILGYLRLSSVGFGQATRNRMAMEVSAGERDRALGYFQSTSLLFLAIGLVVMVGVGLAAVAAPRIHQFLNFEILGIEGLQHALLLLGGVIVINLQVEVLDAGFRCEGHYGLSTFLIMLSELVIFVLVIFVLVTGGGQVWGVACYLAGSVFRFLLLWVVLRSLAPWIVFGLDKASFRTIKTFTLPSLAFMAFPLGQAMSLQGTLIVIGAVLGPPAVVVFNTVRMLSRYTVHLTVTFARIGSPEIAYAYGRGDMTLVRKVHWQVCRLGFWAALLVCAALALTTPWILEVWTQGQINPWPSVYLTLLAAVLLWAAHTLAANVLQATNNHQHFALVFLMASIAGLALAVPLTHLFSLPGAALASLLVEFVVVIYALPRAARFGGGTIGGFLGHVAVPPSPMRLRHLRANAAES
ncbi:MAG: lipopolysaccharide biosynthesis protein [Alphaproteobacteria bacterium]|nr:lipopolysaccharide biosynthesis protein [Alphaproteobacteria bacterium]